MSWFDGHPPDVPRTWPLDAQSVAVIGNGNVALDSARMLAKHVEDLMVTEIPPANVAEGLAASPVTDVHVFGRRGPTSVKFTPLELRELGELRDVDMIVSDEDFDYDDAARAAVAGNKQVFVIDKILQQWRQRALRQAQDPDAPRASRRLHLHFFAKPLELVDDGTGRVGAIRYERTAPDGEGGVVGTGEIREIPPVQAVYRAVGYFGSPPSGRAVRREVRRHPEPRGQVLTRDDESGDARQLYGVYATGWIKRGPPVGLIGHTKSDAMETIRHLINDLGNWWNPRGARGRRDRRTARGPGGHPLDRPRRLAPPRRARARARRGRSAHAHQGRAAPRDGRRLARRGLTSVVE